MRKEPGVKEESHREGRVQGRGGDRERRLRKQGKINRWREEGGNSWGKEENKK